MLHAEGRKFATFTAPSLKDKFNRVIETGYPDITAGYRGRIAYIECKADTKSDPLSFSLDGWNPDQRKWADEVRQDSECEYWLFLTMGSGSVSAKENPDRSWLVPYEAWIQMESQVRPIQATLPYFARKGMRREIQDRQLDAIHLLVDFEVKWKSGRYYVPDEHPFADMYFAPQPQPHFLWRLAQQCPTPLIVPQLNVTATAL